MVNLSVLLVVHMRYFFVCSGELVCVFGLLCVNVSLVFICVILCSGGLYVLFGLLV